MQLLKHFCALGRAPGISASGATLGFTRHVSTSPVNDKRSDQETLYDILGVTRAASIVNIKAAFRKVSMINSPSLQSYDPNSAQLMTSMLVVRSDANFGLQFLCS
jgi:hypothetical protein